MIRKLKPSAGIPAKVSTRPASGAPVAKAITQRRGTQFGRGATNPGGIGVAHPDAGHCGKR